MHSHRLGGEIHLFDDADSVDDEVLPLGDVPSHFDADAIFTKKNWMRSMQRYNDALKQSLKVEQDYTVANMQGSSDLETRIRGAIAAHPQPSAFVFHPLVAAERTRMFESSRVGMQGVQRQLFIALEMANTNLRDVKGKRLTVVDRFQITALKFILHDRWDMADLAFTVSRSTCDRRFATTRTFAVAQLIQWLWRMFGDDGASFFFTRGYCWGVVREFGKQVGLEVTVSDLMCTMTPLGLLIGRLSPAEFDEEELWEHSYLWEHDEIWRDMKAFIATREVTRYGPLG